MRHTSTLDYLESVRDLTESRSDYAIAKKLGISPDSISHYKHRRRVMSADTCRRVAQVLGVPLADVIAAAELERSKTPEKKAQWRKIAAHRVIKAAAMIALFAIDTTLWPANSKAMHIVQATAPARAQHALTCSRV